ncbi:uncharacterized protein LOC132954487 [Labrus mixtus]|uniref:uncharacterized protein LOC132954487 n=1 Tax=Labrus mixtus TaxID=508554 RepID=UPI0029C01BF1|nr:uncharacterized protein LOC132954487 [Labrus mixtus]
MLQGYIVSIIPGTPQQTRHLIRFRSANEQRFLRSKSAARPLWETLIKELAIEGKITPQQVSKKWENLKKKYKELKTPRTGSGTDAGEVTAATWQFLGDMHEVLGARPSMDPPVVVASFGDADPTAILLEMVESTCSDTSGTSDSAASPMASPSPPTHSPPKKKKNSLLNFLIEESAKEQKRHEESEAKTERFLGLFERLIEKI